jgi:hypothetical protein
VGFAIEKGHWKFWSMIYWVKVDFLSSSAYWLKFSQTFLPRTAPKLIKGWEAIND